jgi:hypothetical protein
MAEGAIHSEIEEQLLKEGFVSPADMASARETYRLSLEHAKKPLGIVLTELSNIPQEEVKMLLRHPITQENMGAIALVQQKITSQQLAECRKSAAQVGYPLSAILIQKGYIDEKSRKILLALALDHIDFAKLLITRSFVSEKELEQALKLKAHRKTVCEILYDRNLVTLSELNHVFRKFSRELKLGEILLWQGLISEAQLKEVLKEQSEIKQSLGKILLQKRYIAIEQLYFALSIQYNTPFQRLDGYVYYEKQKASLKSVVGHRYALENHIIPLFQNGNNLTLAVSNPSDIWSMNGLKSTFPELQMSCVLITDEKFNQLYSILYGEIMMIYVPMKSSQESVSASDPIIPLKNPRGQQDLMKRLYEDYGYYREIVGGKPFEDDESFFYSFLEESHRQICETYGCPEVIFRFEIVNGRVEIQASPVQ